MPFFGELLQSLEQHFWMMKRENIVATPVAIFSSFTDIPQKKEEYHYKYKIGEIITVHGYEAIVMKLYKGCYEIMYLNPKNGDLSFNMDLVNE